MQQRRTRQRADRVGLFLRISQHFDDDAEFMCSGVLQRFEIAHHAVFAIDMEEHLSLGLVTENKCNARLDRFDDRIDGRDHDRIARASNRDGTVANRRRTFEFDLVRRMHVLRTAHFDRTITKFGEGAFGQIENAARSGQVVGIGLLVERVRGGRFGGEFSIIRERFQNERILAQDAHRAVRTGAGRRCDGRAFEDLAAV